MPSSRELSPMAFSRFTRSRCGCNITMSTGLAAECAAKSKTSRSSTSACSYLPCPCNSFAKLCLSTIISQSWGQLSSMDSLLRSASSSKTTARSCFPEACTIAAKSESATTTAGSSGPSLFLQVCKIRLNTSSASPSLPASLRLRPRQRKAASVLLCDSPNTANLQSTTCRKSSTAFLYRPSLWSTTAKYVTNATVSGWVRPMSPSRCDMRLKKTSSLVSRAALARMEFPSTFK
mmetsp:Transcript_62770/g.124087  ORF Transcript_62770/g.124087 Transcript_62770/m.124087 type:complete len:234 (+) Transcript_62770:1023-1724(+)